MYCLAKIYLGVRYDNKINGTIYFKIEQLINKFKIVSLNISTITY